MTFVSYFQPLNHHTRPSTVIMNTMARNLGVKIMWRHEATTASKTIRDARKTTAAHRWQPDDFLQQRGEMSHCCGRNKRWENERNCIFLSTAVVFSMQPIYEDFTSLSKNKGFIALILIQWLFQMYAKCATPSSAIKIWRFQWKIWSAQLQETVSSLDMCSTWLSGRERLWCHVIWSAATAPRKPTEMSVVPGGFLFMPAFEKTHRGSSISHSWEWKMLTDTGLCVPSGTTTPGGSDFTTRWLDPANLSDFFSF